MEASVSPEHRRPYAGVLHRLDAGSPAGVLRTRRLPRRVPRAGESHVERVGGGGRGALPGPGSLASRARPGNGRPGCRLGTGAPLSAAAAARRAPSMAADSAARPRRRGRRGRSDARPARRGNRGPPLHGGDAAQRGERPPLRRRRRSGRQRRVLVTVRRGKTNPEGASRDVRFVKGDVAGAIRIPARRGEPGAREPCDAALAPDGGVEVPDVGPVGRRRGAGARPLGARQAGVGADGEVR